MCNIQLLGQNNVGKVYGCETHDLRFVVTWRQMNSGSASPSPDKCPENAAQQGREDRPATPPTARDESK